MRYMAKANCNIYGLGWSNKLSLEEPSVKFICNQVHTNTTAPEQSAAIVRKVTL